MASGSIKARGNTTLEIGPVSALEWESVGSPYHPWIPCQSRRIQVGKMGQREGLGKHGPSSFFYLKCLFQGH